jgi:hypothetical protein
VGFKQSQQYLNMDPALHINRVNDVEQEEVLNAIRRREILARQLSYCKILLRAMR